ncbi:unnamed protein product [Adineta ricciae]|uniref:Uncharacterized protein n=1 Tax=Adineta ricciae TaxID=249248 RepID=A0A816A968_ADIRI|nr:unnamed protein product [Adineta ricciae]
MVTTCFVMDIFKLNRNQRCMPFKQKYIISWAISSVETLETLNLSGNEIEHQGAQELDKPLKTFNLAANRMTDMGTQRYHHTLSINKTLLTTELLTTE